MDKTSSEQQQRCQNQITKCDKKYLQVVLDCQDAETLDKICKTEGISKTDFVRKAIESWSQNETI